MIEHLLENVIIHRVFRGNGNTFALQIFIVFDLTFLILINDKSKIRFSR